MTPFSITRTPLMVNYLEMIMPLTAKVHPLMKRAARSWKRDADMIHFDLNNIAPSQLGNRCFAIAQLAQ
jgi:hypothetical protein